MGVIDGIKDMFNMVGSKRRSQLGVDVSFWDNGRAWYYRNFPPPLNPEKKIGANPEVSPRPLVSGLKFYGSELLPDSVLGDAELERNQSFEMLRRSKMYLGMREPDEELIKKLERRRDWNIDNRPIESNLDLFTSVKYSYSSALPCNKGRVDLVVSKNGSVRFSGVARSRNIRLDPVDAKKISYKRRLEIQRALQWGYDNEFIPVMMTLTIFHDWTWQPLTKLIAVLRNAYEDLFGHKIGGKLKKAIGFQYRIFRMEETLDLEKDGWNPHYHIVLFVPKDNLNILSDLEPKLKARWQKLVQKYYLKFIGEEIPESYLPALYKHGLMLSRYSKDVKDKYGRVIHKKGQLYRVNDSKYLAKIMGCDSAEMYGGDKELSSTLQKNSTTPFDLLRGKPSAEKADLWNEYAIATKGLSCFRFTPGFKDVIDNYFEQNPDRDPVANKSSSGTVVATLKEEAYYPLYRNFKLQELKKQALEGYECLSAWLKDVFTDWGLLGLADEPFALPRPPT